MRPVKNSFTDTEIAKDHVQNIFNIDPPGQPAERSRCSPQLLGNQLLMAASFGRLRHRARSSAAKRLLKRMAMARAGDDRRTRRRTK